MTLFASRSVEDESSDLLLYILHQAFKAAHLPGDRSSRAASMAPEPLKSKLALLVSPFQVSILILSQGLHAITYA